MEAIDIFSYFLLLGLILAGARVVTTSNVIHAAVALVFTLTITAVIFLLLAAEFVGLVQWARELGYGTRKPESSQGPNNSSETAPEPSPEEEVH